MSTAEKEIETLRKQNEQILTQEKRGLWITTEEIDEDFEVSKARRAKEFVESSKEAADAAKDSGGVNLSRRRFLQWSGAAAGLMATAACKRRPVDTLVPYVNKPQGYVYGVPVWYASSAANGYGVLVKTREGRPIKLEGNPDHPVNQGGLDSATHASILDFYNPERLREPTSGDGKKVSWNSVDEFFKSEISNASKNPGSLRVLSGPIHSPSTRAALKKFLEASKGEHHRLEAVGTDPIARAYEILTGASVVPTFHFEKADVVVSVDADFLGSWGRTLEHTKSFSKRRKIHNGDTNVNRLFVFESIYSLTGIAADHRLAIAPSQQLSVLLAISNHLGLGDATLKNISSGYSIEKVSNEIGTKSEILKEAASALSKARGRSIVVAGGCGPDALQVQLVAALMNQALGNSGSTVDLDAPMVFGLEGSNNFELLLSDINAGKVDTLIVQGANPLYALSTKDAEATFKKVKNLITITSEMNETAASSKWVLPESHFLESWGDSEIRAGVFSIQQPAIEPLFDSRSFGEMLTKWAGVDTAGDYRNFVQAYWKQNVYSGGVDFSAWWNEQLRKGATITGKRRGLSIKSASASAHLGNISKAPAGGLQLALYSSVNLKDGAQANNAWLQEVPDPVSKVTWDNFAAISPALAKKLELHQNDVVSIKANGQSVNLAVYIMPGLRGDVVAAAIGYGRRSSGSIANGCGANVLPLSTRRAGFTQLSGMPVEISKTGDRYELACTQKYFDLQGRDHDILQQTTLAEFLRNPHAAKEGHKEHDNFSLYKDDFVYPGPRWGMAIDLNSCTGCNSCVVACYNENNVGIVGADQVRMGRHLAWLRMDLYHKGSAEEVESAFEPMLCQQCAKAPCETVCPVLATVHSSDGLNDMVYNRCVGTRYCANNCPYKVRRFNYFQYSDSLGGKIDMVDPLPMVINPDVTVRSRGIMEKCTFCVQRIRKTVDEYKDQQKGQIARVPDGEIKTACQQSCPSDCISFGDLNDPNSEVSKMSKKAQGFKILEVLNTKPSITYLPRIRNKGTA